MDVNKIQKVAQIGIPVHDLERAIHFYRDLLRIQLLFQTENLAFLECDGLRLFLSLPEKEEFSMNSSIVYFQVDDIHAAYEDYTEIGIPFIDEPHLIAKIGQTETWMAFFKDSEDNTHALMSEINTGM